MHATPGKEEVTLKKHLLALLLALVCVCLTGCAALEEKVFEMVTAQVERTGLEAPTRTIVDSLLAGDIDLMLSALAPELTKEDLQGNFEQMCAMLPPTKEYSLAPTSWKTNTSNGVTQTTVQFLLTAADQTFVVETTSLSNVERVAHFYIAPVPAQEITPVAEASGDISPIEVGFTLISVLEVGFVIWALVDCCRHKISRKWLWVLAILLGNVMLLLTLNGSKLNLNFQLGLHLNATAFKLRDVGFYLSLMVPAGSIAYLIHRKHLLASTSSKGFAEAFSEPAPEAPDRDEQA